MPSPLSHNESLRPSRQLGPPNRSRKEVKWENSEVKAKKGNLAKNVDNLKIQARRVNKLELENLELEGRARNIVQLEAELQELSSAPMVDRGALFDLQKELFKDKKALERGAGRLESIITERTTSGIGGSEDGALAGLGHVALQEELAELSKERAGLQVENRTLQS